MKKLLIAVLLLLLLCGCSAKEESTEAPAAETVTVTLPPTETAPPKTEETPAPEAMQETSADENELFTGHWEIDGLQNEFAPLMEYFGTALRERGAEMTLDPDGGFALRIGDVAGEGTWTYEDGTLSARLSRSDLALTEELPIELTEGENGVQLTLHTGLLSIIWCRAE